MKVSLVELWHDLLTDENILPQTIFEAAAYAGVPDEERGKIWIHMMTQREERTKVHHESDFKVCTDF